MLFFSVQSENPFFSSTTLEKEKKKAKMNELFIDAFSVIYT